MATEDLEIGVNDFVVAEFDADVLEMVAKGCPKKHQHQLREKKKNCVAVAAVAAVAAAAAADPP